MASPRHQRVSIGFQGGQVLSARVTDAALAALVKGLGGGGWQDLEAEDGTIRLDLAQIVYVQTDREEPRVGFSA